MSGPFKWFNSLASFGSALGSALEGAKDTLFEQFIPDDVTDTNGGLFQSEYNTTGLVFPSNLGSSSSYNGHYMMINISVNKNSKSRLSSTERTLENETNRVSNLNASQGALFGGKTMFKMVNTTIVLYMPNTVVFTQANHYEDTSLTNIVKSPLSGLSTAARTIIEGVETGGKLAGLMINPMTEVLFSNTAQRQFQFDFLFAPESREETQNLYNIIRALRFHTAPEWGGLQNAENLWWVEPSQFDITFMNRGQENTNIPRINTCVMETLDVDYAPSGVYSTFTNGYPVSVRVTMRLRERNVLHKELVKAGF